jgi:hypothetical protein
MCLLTHSTGLNERRVNEKVSVEQQSESVAALTSDGDLGCRVSVDRLAVGVLHPRSS